MAFIAAGARHRPARRKRRLLTCAAALASVVAVGLAMTVFLQDTRTSHGGGVAPTRAARADITRLTQQPSPLVEIERQLTLAIHKAEAALGDASSGHEARARTARERIQRLRVELLSMGESGSTAQRQAISQLNRDLQRLLLELDAVAS